MRDFKIGDKVSWTSQSYGYVKKKTGIVFGIVRIGTMPRFRITEATLLGGSRNHKSYVIQVGTRTYWPLVKYLKIAR